MLRADELLLEFVGVEARSPGEVGDVRLECVQFLSSMLVFLLTFYTKEGLTVDVQYVDQVCLGFDQLCFFFYPANWGNSCSLFFFFFEE